MRIRFLRYGRAVLEFFEIVTIVIYALLTLVTLTLGWFDAKNARLILPSIGMLALGLVFHGTLLVEIPFLGSIGQSFIGTAKFPIPASPALCGVEFFLQAFLHDNTPGQSLFGWTIPYYLITAGLFLLFTGAFIASRFSKHWENIFFKAAVSGFWALVALWAVSSLVHLLNQ